MILGRKNNLESWIATLIQEGCSQSLLAILLNSVVASLALTGLLLFSLSSKTPQNVDRAVYNATPTPFLPVLGGGEAPGQKEVQAVSTGVSASVPQQPASSEPLIASTTFHGIDFEDQGNPVTLQIRPADNINHGKDVNISFIPGEVCQFGIHRACMVAYHNPGEENMVVFSVHSGVGGEAQDYRHLIEGTWVDQAGKSLTEVRKTMSSLVGSRVEINQGDKPVQSGTLVRIIRVPAVRVAEYLQTPLDSALKFADRVSPDVYGQYDPSKPGLVLETCGWRMPQELKAEGTTDTSASIYISIIQ